MLNKSWALFHISTFLHNNFWWLHSIPLQNNTVFNHFPIYGHLDCLRFSFNNMAVMNTFLLSFCHIFPGIISRSLPRSWISGWKAMHVLMSLCILGRDSFLMYWPLQDSNSFCPLIFSNLIGEKKSHSFSLVIVKVEHLFTHVLAFSEWFLIIESMKGQEKSRGIRDFQGASQNPVTFWENTPQVPYSSWNW